MMVKVCGITTVEDARAAMEAGAQAVGLNFYPGSPRHVTLGQACAIAEAAGRILKVGVFVNEPAARVREIVDAVGLDVAQLHGDETPEQAPPGVRVWKAGRVMAGWNAARLTSFPAEAFLLDAPTGALYGGSGETFAWHEAASLQGHRIIVAGGLDDTNVGDAIRALRPWGVDVCSRIESAPGRKDPVKMTRFIQAALSEAI